MQRYRFFAQMSVSALRADAACASICAGGGAADVFRYAADAATSLRGEAGKERARLFLFLYSSFLLFISFFFSRLYFTS